MENLQNFQERQLTQGELLVINAKRITGFDLVLSYISQINNLQIENVSADGLEKIKQLFLNVINLNNAYEYNIMHFNDGMDKLLQEGKISQEDYDNFYKDTKIRLFNAFINYYNSIEQKAKKQKEYYQNLLNNLTNQ